MPTPLPSPGPLPSPLPGPEPEPGPDGGGPGGGSGPATSMPPMILPCPIDADPCQYINYAAFIAQLQQAIEAEKNNRFDEAMQILAGDRVKIVLLPKLMVDRPQVVLQIFRLEVQSINLVEARLRDDLARLTPFPTDSPELQQQKLAVVQQDDQQRRQLWKQTVDQNRSATVNSPASRSSSESESSDGGSESGGSFRFQSEAYQQAVQIHLTGNWGN